MKSKFLPFLLSFILITVVSKGQNYLGVATTNYSRINSMYLNPANITNGVERFTFSLFSIGIDVDNNLGTFSKISDLGKSLNSKDSGSNSQSVFTNSGRANFSMMIPEVNIHGPAVIISINRKNSVAITTGLRVINQFNNFDQTLYNTIINTSTAVNGNLNYTTHNFNWTAHMWNEIGLSYAGVFIDNDRSLLKAGFTVRRLGGVGYLSLKGNSLDLHYQSGSDSFFANNSDLEFASNVVNDRSAVFNGVNTGNLLGRFFGATDGIGVGGDIGVVYRYRIGKLEDANDKESGKSHDIVISAAVKDMGSINYSKNVNANISVTGNGFLTGKGLSKNVNDATSFKNYLQQQGFSADTSSVDTKLHMPTTLILSADYEIHKRIFVNATFISNLANRQDFGNSYYNRLAVTPRYDTRLISFAIPISYSWLAKDIKMGFGFRFSGFFIGSDDMLALFSAHQYGFGFYMGGYVPIKFKRQKRLEEHDHWERFVQ